MCLAEREELRLLREILNEFVVLHNTLQLRRRRAADAVLARTAACTLSNRTTGGAAVCCCGVYLFFNSPWYDGASRVRAPVELLSGPHSDLSVHPIGGGGCADLVTPSRYANPLEAIPPLPGVGFLVFSLSICLSIL